MIVLFFLLALAKTIRVIPQARAGVVERLGRYSRTLTPGLTLVVPFVDRVKPLLDLREQAVSFEPQPVITEDNLVVNIDTVIYFQVTDPKSATYEIANPVNAIDLLTVTTLRNVIGGMTLEQTLTSRETINDQLRGILDEATGQVGDPRPPRRAEVRRPAAVDQGHDGEADARRPREARGDPPGRGRQAGADPDRRGREAVGDPQGGGPEAGGDPRRPGAGRGDRHRLHRRSTRATPTRSCSPTSTCRCCRRSRRATRTRSG